MPPHHSVSLSNTYALRLKYWFSLYVLKHPPRAGARMLSPVGMFVVLYNNRCCIKNGEARRKDESPSVADHSPPGSLYQLFELGG